MEKEFKYYKLGVNHYQVSDDKLIVVLCSEEAPQITTYRIGHNKFGTSGKEVISMRKFEEAYLWTRHQLDKQALQSRKLKTVQQ